MMSNSYSFASSTPSSPLSARSKTMPSVCRALSMSLAETASSSMINARIVCSNR